MRLLSLLYFTLITLTFCGQSEINGLVIDQGNQPLPGANIYIEGTFEGTSSDLDGNFMISTRLSGDFILVVEFLGFEARSFDLVLPADSWNETIVLKEKFNELKAATISAGAFEASDTKKAVVLRPLDIVTTAGASGDISGALQTLPGTSTVGESGKLFVRGGDSEETATFIDGLLVYKPYNSAAPNTATRGRFNPFMFSGTVFSTGGYSAEYGQALSSALVLNTNGIPEQGQLNLGIMSVGGDIAGTALWDRGAVTASLNYLNLAPYLAVVPQNYTWDKPVRSTSGAVSVRQKTGKAGMLKFYTNLSESSFTLTQKNSEYEEGKLKVDLRNRNGFANLSYLTPVSDELIIKVGGSYTLDQDKIGLNNDLFKEELEGWHAKVSSIWQAMDRIKIRSGLEIFGKVYSQKYLADSLDFQAEYKEVRQAAFIETDIHLTNKIVARIGARGEHSNLLDQWSIAPRLSAAYKLNEYSQISAAYGWFFQNPLDDYLIYSTNLDLERADHYILSGQFTKKSRTLRAEAYYKNYANLVKYDPSLPNYLTAYENSGTGFAYGLDVFWRDKSTIKNGDYWVSYSYLESERDYRYYPNPAVPTFVSKHNFSFVYKHWFSKIRSQVGLTYMYGSPRRYNDLNESGFNEGRLKAYNSLNMNVSFLFRQNIIFFASATNIMGFKNEFGYTFSSAQNSQGDYSKEAIVPGADRFFFIGCFITLSKNSDLNQLDKINDQ
ncbi:MAG: hypothetical protein ACI84C_001995 [Flavobacteriales bacterium]